MKKNAVRNLTLLDPETGAIVEGQLALFQSRGRQLVDWIRIFEQGLLLLAKARLNGREATMVFYLLAQVDSKNEVALDRSLCFAYTGIYEGDQYRTLHSLIEKKILYKGRKINSLQILRFNPLLS